MEIGGSAKVNSADQWHRCEPSWLFSDAFDHGTYNVDSSCCLCVYICAMERVAETRSVCDSASRDPSVVGGTDVE